MTKSEIIELARRTVIWVLVVLMPSCSFIPGTVVRDRLPVQGKVVEAVTGRPIAGALVVQNWEAYLWHSYCTYTKLAVSDERGEYQIQLSPKEALYLKKTDAKRDSVIVYKKGYRNIFDIGLRLEVGKDYVASVGEPDHDISDLTRESLGFNRKFPASSSRPEDVTMLPDWWGVGDSVVYLVTDKSVGLKRITHLFNLTSSAYCSPAREKQRDIAPFYAAIATEALQLSSDADQQEIVAHICDNFALAATATIGQPKEYLKTHMPLCVGLQNSVEKQNQPTMRYITTSPPRPVHMHQ